MFFTISNFKTNKTLVTLSGVLLIIGGLLYFFFGQKPEDPIAEIIIPEIKIVETKNIGLSVENREISVTSFGRGDTDLLFVGGIHGGYEWNSVLLSYEMIDYFTENPSLVPEELKIHIIPSLNPDGLFDVIKKEGRFTLSDVPSDEGPLGNGRFNANGVDLNRNFDCKWEPESSWRGNVVSAGSSAFSEPEALALKKYVDEITPQAAIFWHSQANTVYASECENGILPETILIMNAYADAAGYNKVESFDAYPITGDVEGWLASIGIPAITVELKTHSTVEFNQNLKGFQALLDFYTTEKTVILE